MTISTDDGLFARNTRQRLQTLAQVWSEGGGFPRLLLGVLILPRRSHLLRDCKNPAIDVARTSILREPRHLTPQCFKLYPGLRVPLLHDMRQAQVDNVGVLRSGICGDHVAMLPTFSVLSCWVRHCNLTV